MLTYAGPVYSAMPHSACRASLASNPVFKDLNTWSLNPVFKDLCAHALKEAVCYLPRSLNTDLSAKILSP